MEILTKWDVFLAFVAIVAFCITIYKVCKFFSSFENSLGNLNDSLNSLNIEINELTNHNRDAHKRLWEKNGEQDKTLFLHETRITSLEKGGKE